MTASLLLVWSDAERRTPVLAAGVEVGARFEQQPDDGGTIAGGCDHERGDPSGIRGVHFRAVIDQQDRNVVGAPKWKPTSTV